MEKPRDGLREEDFIFRVVKDPANPPQALLLTGFTGKSSEPGCSRVYLDVMLSSYVDLPDDQILHAQEVPPQHSPLGGHFVWVRRNPELMAKVRDAYRRASESQQEIAETMQTDGVGTAVSAGGFPMAPGWPNLGG